MSNRIDSAGTYRGEILEAGLSTTKNGFPQWVVRLKAAEKWVDDAVGIKHFGLEGPTWVDWSSFDEDTLGYLVLFKSNEEFSEETALLNYEQIQLAVDWDGTEFDSLNDDSHVGKKVLFRVEEHTFNDKTSLQLNWIDAYEASPVRELKKLDTDGLKQLTGKLKIKKKAAPAVAKPGKAAAPSPAKEKAGKPAATPPKAAPKPAPEPTPEPEPQEADTSGLPEAVSQGEAWEFVCEHKGGNEDSEIEKAWISAVTEVLNQNPDKAVTEDDMTPADWAKVRDTIVHDLALDVE